MRYGNSRWDDANVPQGPVWVRIDLTHQLLSVFRAGHEIGTAVILYGAADRQSPTGTFPVLEKAEDYHSRTYDAAMPYSLRLTADGVAIHGADVRRGAATHGCIGVPTDFARRLFAEVKLGDPVVILPPAS
jgi:lipoprotein-anchoring transpeptidase ErfK/SrfK